MPPSLFASPNLHYTFPLRDVLWLSPDWLFLSSRCVDFESGGAGVPHSSISTWLCLLDIAANPKRDLSRKSRKMCRATVVLRLGCLHHLLPFSWFRFSRLLTDLRVLVMVVDLWLISLSFVCCSIGLFVVLFQFVVVCCNFCLSVGINIWDNLGVLVHVISQISYSVVLPYWIADVVILGSPHFG
ncbi:unnamed protein product [Prunus brigantina]